MALESTQHLMGVSFADRFAARLVDWAILLIPFMMLHFSTIPFLGPLFFSALYYIFFECSAAQATPGKRLAGIKVVSASGGRISLVTGALRCVFRILSAGLCGIPYFAMLFTRYRQTAHDLLSDTYVVTGKNEEPLVESWLNSFKEFLHDVQARFKK